MEWFNNIFKELDRAFPGTNWTRIYWIIFIGALIKTIIEKL